MGTGTDQLVEPLSASRRVDVRFTGGHRRRSAGLIHRAESGRCGHLRAAIPSNHVFLTVTLQGGL